MKCKRALQWKHSPSGSYTLIWPESPERGNHRWTLNAAIAARADVEVIAPWEAFDDYGEATLQKKPRRKV